VGRMPFIEAAGVDMYYVEHGPGAHEAEQTLVLLHGFTVDHRSNLAAFEPCFADRPRWRRLYLDLPGMGHTQAPDWVTSTDDVFAVTQAAVSALVPGRYALAGGSFGGYLSLGLAAADPHSVVGLCLNVPMVEPVHEHRDVPPPTLLVEEASLGDDPYELTEASVVLTDETVRRLNDEVVAAIADGDPVATDRIFASYAGSFPLVSAERPFAAPSLVLLGRQDNIVGYRDQWPLTDAMPRASYAVLDLAGHHLQIEQPVLFEALVGEWLDRVDEAS
jgi:pimeloyl-ACP methyl ester carboxylesterase